jgi:hypothetical protein
MMSAMGSICAFFKSRGRLWSFLVVLLLASQVGLGVHRLQHHLTPDAVAADDCKLCQLSNHATTAPEPVTVLPPVLVVTEVAMLPARDLLQAQRFAAGFRSRAPPTAVSA